MTPMQRVNEMIATRRATYFSAGVSSGTRGKVFVSLWGKERVSGYGSTIDEALVDAMNRLEKQSQRKELPI